MANLNNIVKKKQYYLIGGLLGLIVLGSMTVVYTKKNSVDTEASQSDKPDIVMQRFSGIGSNVNEDEIWRANSSNEIDDLRAKNRDLIKEVGDIKRDISKQIQKAVSDKSLLIEEKLTTTQQEELTKIRNENERLKAEAEERSRILSIEAAESQKRAANEILVTRKVFERQHPGISDDLGSYKGEDLVKKRAATLQSLSFSVDTISTADELERLRESYQDKAEKEARKGLSVKEYVPAGTYVRGLILGGIDAPTGGQAQTDPYPVLLEVSDIADLPNNFKYDFKSCRVIGSGYGDISSERAIIRLEKMSCVSEDDLVFESMVKGFIYDETGKMGMKGRLVSKQGQLIANGLFAGIGAGIGSAFQRSSTQYTSNALGTNSESFISAQDAAVSGMGQGVATSFDRLSRYYIDLAEKIFPVIEVDAGRMVDLVFTSGFYLQPLQEALTDEGSGMLGQGINREMTIGNLIQGGSDTVSNAMQSIRR